MDDGFVYVSPETGAGAGCDATPSVTLASEGLDRTSADQLQLAKHYQGKDQLRLALGCFQIVLESHPECTEARNGLRVTLAAIREQKENARKGRLFSVLEALAKKNKDTEMEIEWSYSGKTEHGYWPDLKQVARKAARDKLEIIGIDDSFLNLIDIEVSEDVGEAEDRFVSGLAKFRLTLLPNDTLDLVPSLPVISNDSDEHESQNEQDTSSERTFSRRKDASRSVQPASSVDGLPTDGTSLSTLTMSQFADNSSQNLPEWSWQLVDVKSKDTVVFEESTKQVQKPSWQLVEVPGKKKQPSWQILGFA